MATRVTYHQINVCPATEDNDNSVIIPHVQTGWCQVVNTEFIGGGGDNRFMLHVVAFEPVDEPVDEPQQSETG